MTKAYVYACSNDPCWREVVKKTGNESLVVDASQWPAISNNPLGRTDNLKSKVLVLIDVYQLVDIKDAIRSLHDQGWDYVVVVARSPSAVEARDVLYGNLGYDYWKKTYIVSEIRASIQVCFDEINSNESIKRSENIVASIKTDQPRGESSL